jgi:hypothetical protein
MKKLLRSTFPIFFGALLFAGAGVSSEAASAQVLRPGAFDGNWSVVIHTLRGDCGSALRYGVRIIGGRVVGDSQNYQVAGAVKANGTIRVMVAEGGRSATGAGRLVGNTGTGLWRTAKGECSGQWTAARRDW